MNAERNTRAKATCCMSDLRFLLQIAKNYNLENQVFSLIYIFEKNPTEPVITAAWKQAAMIHDEIRRKL